MTSFTVATFNVQNLIGPEQDYYRFERYSPEEFASKRAWLAGQLGRMNPDIVGFQEIFEPDPLRQVIADADERAAPPILARPSAGGPSSDASRAFCPPAYRPYGEAALAFAPNLADGGPGERRPGLAVLSRFGFAEEPQAIQFLDPPVDIAFHHLGGGDAGSYQIKRLARPVLKVRIPVGGRIITVFNAHLKSRLGEFVRPHGAHFSPEIDLLTYDAAGRAMGALRSAMRRAAEAWVLRKLILDELDRDRPVIVLGDFNDSAGSVTQDIIAGERPYPDYGWLRRHDATQADAFYTGEEAAQIREQVERVRLHSAERLFLRRALRDTVYTTSYGGVLESFDAILLSRHFHPDWPGRIGEMAHFSVFNDHITDGSFPEAPWRSAASDHGQVMAHITMR